MRITRVQVTLASNRRMRGLASVTLEDEFVVHDIRIIDGPRGLFVAMPSKKTPAGAFKDVAHPTTQAFRAHVEQAIIAEYQRVLTLASGEPATIDLVEA